MVVHLDDTRRDIAGAISHAEQELGRLLSHDERERIAEAIVASTGLAADLAAQREDLADEIERLQRVIHASVQQVERLESEKAALLATVDELQRALRS